MPVARIQSAALWGVEAYPVWVEADVSTGLPVFTTVGLPDSAVRESRVRVKSAVHNSGFEFPTRRLVVNLAPADLPKQGTGLDLPIALAILAASGQLAEGLLAGVWALGELSLEGRVRPVPGVLPVLLAARRRRVRLVLAPPGSAGIAGWMEGAEVWEVESLGQCIEAIAGGRRPPPRAPGAPPEGAESDTRVLDLADVRGQAQARRALEIAAAGGHSLLLSGPPGAGKTMLAQRLPTLLPDLEGEERLDVSCIYSVVEPERLRAGPITRPPFRAPHHTVSACALIGGGGDPRPGEISLAHRGILFLDELGEFRPAVLETLRQPLEEGEVRLSRHRRSVRFPARPILVAALNPCPCGYRGDPQRPCECSPSELRRFRRCLSGPLLDRIDLRVETPRPAHESMAKASEPSAIVRQRVIAARARMKARAAEMQTVDGLPPEARQMLLDAMERFALSPRAVDRVLRVTRTIADLDAADVPSVRHLAEAVQYRVTLDP